MPWAKPHLMQCEGHAHGRRVPHESEFMHIYHTTRSTGCQNSECKLKVCCHTFGQSRHTWPGLQTVKNCHIGRQERHKTLRGGACLFPIRSVPLTRNCWLGLVIFFSLTTPHPLPDKPPPIPHLRELAKCPVRSFRSVSGSFWRVLGCWVGSGWG